MSENRKPDSSQNDSSTQFQARSAQAMKGARRSLGNVKVGPGQYYHNMTLFPLFVSEDPGLDYLLLHEAIEQGLAEVREVSESGSVGQLLVENRAPRPVLIPEGEILTGAKQDRTVNITILIAASSELVIPVSCVEQGRWSRTSSNFASSHFSTPRLRAKVSRSVKSNRDLTGVPSSDQMSVWNDVSYSLMEASAVSATDSLKDAFAEKKEILGEYTDSLELPADAAGVLIASGDQIIGMDLFDSPATLQKIWPRMSRGYYLEASSRKEEARSDKALAEDFLKKLPAQVNLVKKPIGSGDELEVAGEDVTGGGLSYEGSIVHLGAMAMEKN